MRVKGPNSLAAEEMRQIATRMKTVLLAAADHIEEKDDSALSKIGSLTAKAFGSMVGWFIGTTISGTLAWWALSLCGWSHVHIAITFGP